MPQMCFSNRTYENGWSDKKEVQMMSKKPTTTTAHKKNKNKPYKSCRYTDAIPMVHSPEQAILCRNEYNIHLVAYAKEGRRMSEA